MVDRLRRRAQAGHSPCATRGSPSGEGAVDPRAPDGARGPEQCQVRAFQLAGLLELSLQP